MENIKPRVYALAYTFSPIYGRDSKNEDRIEYFSRDERDKFIKRYLYLKSQFHMSNIKPYYADLQEVDMNKIIDAI